MIYNDEDKVSAFLKEVINSVKEKSVDLIAFTPETKGEELLNKIFNFFDEVERK